MPRVVATRVVYARSEKGNDSVQLKYTAFITWARRRKASKVRESVVFLSNFSVVSKSLVEINVLASLRVKVISRQKAKE